MNPTAEDIERVRARITQMKAEIPAKAATDPEFHDALKANPQATIEKFYGLSDGLLKEIDIRIFEEAPGSIGLVIPPDATQMEEELTEDQLEAVAGGAAITFTTVVVISAIGMAAIAGGMAYRTGRTVERSGGWGD